MTIKEFFKSNEKLAIHCDTKEKAKALCNAFDREGYTWRSGCIRYTECTYWDEGICYSNENGYADREYYENKGYRILEFEDIDGINFNVPNLEEEIKACISLLEQSGRNTKLEVKKRLERILELL